MISRTGLTAAYIAVRSWSCSTFAQANVLRGIQHYGIAKSRPLFTCQRSDPIRLKSGHQRAYSSLTPREDEPLRILFCSSDDFGVTCLRALYHYSRLADSNIATIDVATRPDKRVGRNRATVVSTPIKYTAEQLMLPVHQFDTFTGWNLPEFPDEENSQINMIIAVSFGLFVPPRILRACEFGGLNVHPSLLPDLKGSSPVEHTIMNGDLKTGITIQTLHETKFDEGAIVLQTPRPGLSIPDPNSITAPRLKDILSDIGAQMLVRTIKERLYLHPQGVIVDSKSPAELRVAPKLTTESRHVDFANMSSIQVLRFKRALGELWAIPVVPAGIKGMNEDTRVKFKDVDIRLARQNEVQDIPVEALSKIEPGIPFCVSSRREKIETSMAPLLVKAADGVIMAIPRMIVSGMPFANASALAKRAQLFEDHSVLLGDSDRQLTMFRHKLS